MTTNFYSTNQFLYEPKLLFHNSQVSYFHNRTVPTPYYIRQSGKDTEETQASRSRVPEEAYRIEKRINNYLLIINFILTGKR